MPCSLLRPASRRSSLREMMDSLITHSGGTAVGVRVKRPVPVPPDPTDAGLSRKDNTTMRAEVTPHALTRQALPEDRLLHRPGLLSGRCGRTAGLPLIRGRTRYLDTYAVSGSRTGSTRSRRKSSTYPLNSRTISRASFSLATSTRAKPRDRPVRRSRGMETDLISPTLRSEEHTYEL